MNSQAPFDTPLDPVEEAIFHTASELVDAQARAAFLDKVCAQDAGLRARLEVLLRADQQAVQFFADDPLSLSHRQPSIIKAVPPDTGDEAVGMTLGRYKLLEKLGEGGCGVVYVAEQTEPMRRRVALKVIKLGMDTKQVVARFEAERQALAMMEHPNIAKVLDAGTTETGRPYFVMELVRGIRITDYCDENNLPTKERLDLFIKVCQAIQHAHQKGIIHRDIKPSNILITLHDGVPVPKVIDFGIAKATEGRLTDATVYTQLHQFIGTPAYMSPEQAEMSGLDVDTRSDIYSLGVLLYELLVGRTPFDGKELMKSGLDAMRKTIREQEPVRPSTRLAGLPGDELTTAAKRRGSDVPKLVHLVKGDLDWIVMKCLEKHRTRRYETANGLAFDLKRHLNNEPVLACPPSTAYRFQKAFQRNKLAWSAAAAVVFALIIGLGLTTWQFIDKSRAYKRAVIAEQTTEKARTAEFSQRQRAEAEALRARQFQYASDMNLAHQAVDDGNLFRALQLLERHRPGFGVPALAGSAESRPGGEPDRLKAGLQTDLRGWEWRYLWKQCQSEEILTLGSHSNGVNTVGFMLDGKTAFSGGNDKAVRLWDMNSMKEVGSIPHDAEVTGASCSPDGRWLVTTTNKRLVIRELATQSIATVITNQWYRPNTLVFSPDSQLLAYGDFDKGVFVWDLDARKEIARLPATFGYVAPLGLAFSPDGQGLAYAETESGEIVLWNIREKAVMRRWRGHAWYITRLFFTPDGKLLISGSADRTVKLWEVASGQEVNRFNYPLGFGPSLVSSPRLSVDGKMLASAASGGGMAITIQEIPSGKELLRLRGSRDLVADGAFSPDGRTFISGSLDGTVRLWDLTRKAKDTFCREFPPDNATTSGTFWACSLSPDGRHLLNVFTNGTFSIREIPTLREGPRHPIPMQKLASFAVAAGGQLAAFVADDGQVVFWREDTGETNFFGRPITKESIRAVFSLDGRRFAVGSGKEIAVCDVPSGNTCVFPVGEPSALFFLRFSSDAQKLMAAYFDGLVKFWDFTKANPELTLRGDDLQVNGVQAYSVALLPDGKTLVSVSRQILFWDVETARIRSRLQPRATVFRTVAISPDGRRLAVGAADGFITIWDLASMQEVATLAGHTRPLLDLRFLPDGDTLVSVAVNEVRVWRAASLQEADNSR
jgi:WD40 repeat protein/serine/threonine protein kinase